MNFIFRFNGSTNEQTAETLSEYSTIHRLPAIRTNDSISHSLNTRKPSTLRTRNISSSFRRRSASITPENRIPSNESRRNNFLTSEQLKHFLQKEEHIQALSIEDCSRLIHRFEPTVEGRQSDEIGVDGLRLLLLHDEFCIMNSDKVHRVYHDMTRPLTDYFIATSHNT